MKAIPTIERYMTVCPHTIGKDQTLAAAHRMLKQNHIRHLPVLDGGRILGIVSDRDLGVIETLRDVDPEKITVEDAMQQDVYQVSPGARLNEVVNEMAAHKYGSAVVMDNQKVVGIFTTIDALKALAGLLETRLAS